MKEVQSKHRQSKSHLTTLLSTKREDVFVRKTISYLFTKEEMNKIELREKAIELGLGIFFTGLYHTNRRHHWLFLTTFRAVCDFFIHLKQRRVGLIFFCSHAMLTISSNSIVTVRDLTVPKNCGTVRSYRPSYPYKNRPSYRYEGRYDKNGLIPKWY